MIETTVTHCSDCVVSAGGWCPFTPREVKTGQHLWHQGEVPTEVLFVRQGLLSLTGTEPSGSESLSSVRGPRSLLGAESLTGRPAAVSVEALTDATVCSASPQRLTEWVGPTTPASTLLTLLVDENTRAARDASLRTGPSVARVARFLLEFADLVEGGRRAPFSKQHVARLLGMRAETLSRSLRHLVDAGVVASGRHVQVTDADRLSAFARGPV